MADTLDRQIILLLQGDIPLTPNPYHTMATQLGISETELVGHLQRLQRQGKLKRIAAILRHQQAGYAENAMAVFLVPSGEIDRIGQLVAALPWVSHCYQRQSYPDWPYNLYAMCHSKTPGFIAKAVADFAATQQITAYQTLPSLQELKKTSLVFA